MTVTTVKDQWKPIVSQHFDPERVQDVRMITNGGSEREFFRVNCGDDTCILLEYRGKHEGLQDYINIDTFYASKGIAVPRIIAGSAEEGVLLLEDLGDESLYTRVLPLLSEGRHDEVIAIYKDVITELLKLQSVRTKEAPFVIRSRRFDFRYYRYETDYFREKCCGDFFHVDALNNQDLTWELEKLARMLEKSLTVIVHRDFQSQNICLRDGKVYFIDFQAGRLGSQFYDVASLLKDPYVELPFDIQDELLEFYMTEQRKHRIWPGLARKHGKMMYHLVSLQRLMQALGAYGKLGVGDGKTRFLQYIPPAVRLLNRTLENMGEFPLLKELTKNLSLSLVQNSPVV